MWIVFFKVCQVNVVDVFFCNCFMFGFCYFMQFQFEGDIVQDVCLGQQGKILKDEGVVWFWFGYRFVVDFDFVGGWFQEIGNDF